MSLAVGKKSTELRGRGESASKISLGKSQVAEIETLTALARPRVPRHALTWLSRHHYVTKDTKTEEEIHVFGMAGPPLGSPDNKTEWDIDVDIPIGPVILKFEGHIDLTQKKCAIDLYVKVPIIPAISLGSLTGDLTTGVSLTVGVDGIIRGEIKIQVNDKVVTLTLAANIFGQDHSFEVPLLKLP